MKADQIIEEITKLTKKINGGDTQSPIVLDNNNEYKLFIKHLSSAEQDEIVNII